MWRSDRPYFRSLRRDMVGKRFPGLVTPQEAARSLGVGLREMMSKVRTLEVLTVRMNGERMIPEVELQRYLDILN